MVRPTLLAGTLLVLSLVGCGGGGGGHKDTPQSIRLSGANSVAPSGVVNFVAFVEGGGRVTWSVDGGSANGTISETGLYTAPRTQGTYTIRASVGSQVATATVTVTNGVTIALTSPTAVPLTIPRSTLKFSAAVTGASDTGVDWSVAGQTGAIASDGTFTAPSSTGYYIVVGKSHADPTKSVSAVVEVVANLNVRVKWQGRDDVVFALRPDKAPGTAANYVSLVNKGFYDGIVAHRYVANFVIQWGDPLTKTLPLSDPSIGSGGPGYAIPFEVNDLSNVRGSLAMARAEAKDSAGSQVYVNLVDNASLDHTDTNQGYVVFGAVLSGQTTIDALRAGDKIVSATTERP